MPQFGMVVYSPAPADPMAMSPEHLARLNAYPDEAKALRGKVLGGTYFAKERGFALNPSTEAMTVQGAQVKAGTLTGSDLVISAFYVLAAPDIDVAVAIAKLHPAVDDGAIEIHPVFVPAGQDQDDYAD